MSWMTKQLNQYCMINQLIAGQVYKGCLVDDETTNLAIKTIKLNLDQPDNIDVIKHQIIQMQKLHNQNLVYCYDVIKANQMLHFVQENCEDGNLSDYLNAKKEKYLSERESIYLLRQILQGYKQLHANGVIHNNIKPSNILLSQGIVKLTDSYYQGALPPYIALCTPNSGALQSLQHPSYLSPQVLLGQLFTEKCDVWSIGLVLFEVLYAKLPWDVSSVPEWIEHIKKYPATFPIRPMRSQAIKDLLSKMLVVQENDRISFEDLLEEPLIVNIQESQNEQQYKDEMEKAIKFNASFLLQNRVRGYFKDSSFVEMTEENIPPQIQARIQQCQFSKNYKANGDIVIRRYKNDKVWKVNYRKYIQFFTFQRNVAFFFNQLSQKLINLYWDLQLPIDLYHRLLYLIVKNLMINIQNIIIQLNDKQNDQFDKEYWGRFHTSQQYKILLQYIEEDYQNLMPFYIEIANKASQIQQEEYEKNKSNQLIVGLITNFLSVVNTTFEANETFNVLYRENVQECLRVLKSLNSKQVDVNLFHFYLLVSLNPYDEFKDINYDFNLFYEDSEYFSIQELTERIQKKIK